MGEKNVFSTKRAPLPTGGAPYLLGMAQSCAKRAPFRDRRRFSWWGGRRICFERRRHGQNGAFCARRAPARARGRRICLKGRHRGRKGALFVPEGRPHWYDSRHICLEGPDTGVKCTFSCFAGGRGTYLLRMPSWVKKAPFRVRRAPSLAGRAPYLL